MSSESDAGEPDSEAPRWHEALAYAVCGRRFEGLPRQRQPDIAALANWLRQVGAEPVPGSQRVPEDLMRGIGAAQFLAALSALREALALDAHPLLVRPAANRLPTAEELRLLADVPPHHGT